MRPVKWSATLGTALHQEKFEDSYHQILGSYKKGLDPSKRNLANVSMPSSEVNATITAAWEGVMPAATYSLALSQMGPMTTEVVDWTSSTTGKLGSISISISTVGTPPLSDSSLFGGSVVSRIFSSGHFAGPVSLVKTIEVYGKSQQVANTYTVTFSAPVTDVRVHLGSLASVVTFNQPVTRLSGQSSFRVTGSTVTGAVDNSDSLTDSNGTIGLSGTLNSFSFTTVGLPNVGLADGIAMQISARP
jgi:hypothetical protein